MIKIVYEEDLQRYDVRVINDKGRIIRSDMVIADNENQVQSMLNDTSSALYKFIHNVG